MTGIVRERERERVHMARVSERIGALKTLVVFRLEPRPPVWRVLYPLCYVPKIETQTKFGDVVVAVARR